MGGSEGAAAVADEYARAKKSYDGNPVRRAKALDSPACKAHIAALLPEVPGML